MQTQSTVTEYLNAVPEQARDYLEKLRQLVKDEAPEAAEVVSYGILGYKLPGINRAFAYISGYAKHVSVYPIPSNVEAAIAKAMEPHIAGKGTLHFELDKPLPLGLIRQVIQALYLQAKTK